MKTLFLKLKQRCEKWLQVIQKVSPLRQRAQTPEKVTSLQKVQSENEGPISAGVVVTGFSTAHCSSTNLPKRRGLFPAECGVFGIFGIHTTGYKDLSCNTHYSGLGRLRHIRQSHGLHGIYDRPKWIYEAFHRLFSIYQLNKFDRGSITYNQAAL